MKHNFDINPQNEIFLWVCNRTDGYSDPTSNYLIYFWDPFELSHVLYKNLFTICSRNQLFSQASCLLFSWFSILRIHLLQLLRNQLFICSWYWNLIASWQFIFVKINVSIQVCSMLGESISVPFWEGLGIFILSVISYVIFFLRIFNDIYSRFIVFLFRIFDVAYPKLEVEEDSNLSVVCRWLEPSSISNFDITWYRLIDSSCSLGCIKNCWFRSVFCRPLRSLLILEVVGLGDTVAKPVICWKCSTSDGEFTMSSPISSTSWFQAIDKATI